jgi:hypothetical protein
MKWLEPWTWTTDALKGPRGKLIIVATRVLERMVKK